MQSPHTAARWTIGRYSLYLDEVSDADLWQFVCTHCAALGDDAALAALDGAQQRIVKLMRQVGSALAVADNASDAERASKKEVAQQ